MRIQSAIPAARPYARPPLAQAVAAIGTVLRTWRARARARNAAVRAWRESGERQHVPHARGLTMATMIKPFGD